MESDRWAEAADVFQVGLLAATLADRAIWRADDVSAKSIADLPISDELKSWVWHATGARARRYWNAREALEALDALKRVSVRPSRAPRTLNGETLVLTGTLEGLPRHEATRLARQAGATVQRGITDSTSVVVAGRIKAGSTGAEEGLKLFGVRERLRLGQRIRIISGQQFKRLVA